MLGSYQVTECGKNFDSRRLTVSPHSPEGGKESGGCVHSISCALLGAQLLSLLVHSSSWLLHGPGRIVTEGLQCYKEAARTRTLFPPEAGYSWTL